ncbi:MAG: N-acetyl-gamma-glutamyl-phosphate reductase [Anaerolineae bacterium]
MVKVGVYGATGYTGLELVRILQRHPDVSLAFATSESRAGVRLRDVFPVPWEMPLVSEASADLSAVDAVFCCLPHGAAMATVVAARAAGARVIDLSADFRLRDPATYQQWYGLTHAAPHLLPQAVYGLPEVYRQEISRADLVANPGCYPTSVLLALYPLLRAGLVADGPLIADSKSGVSGAGRKPSPKTHFVEAYENFSPYNIGRAHRHLPEMAQEIERLGGQGDALIFAPHLTPVNRGILSTIYVPVSLALSVDDLHNIYSETYANEPFIWLLPGGELSTMSHAVHTNRCVLSLTLVRPGQLIVCSAIDNLVKGAAGQAVQNFNLMFGLEETQGLDA